MSSPLEVAIIGGGASGLLCALYAKRGDTSVTVYEKNAKLGKKLLTTGNGRCNFTNRNLVGKYNCDAFAKRFLLDLESEFAALGVCSYADCEGRVYPITESAKTVLDCIVRELDGVKFVYNREINSIKKDGNSFILSGGGSSFGVDAAVLATGGAARAECNIGSLLPKEFLTPLYPSLTPLITDCSLKALDGLRRKCTATLYAEGRAVASEAGEVQFRSFGLSGIVCFNMSAHVARKAGEGRIFSIGLDLFPDINPEYLKKLLHERYIIYGDGLFLGLCDQRLAREAEKRVGVINEGNVASYAGVLKDMTFGISGLGGFDAAQVTVGGVRTELLSETLELIDCKGLYVCGEAIDIDGVSGGYNLAWAFSSGIAAGKAIAQKSLSERMKK